MNKLTTQILFMFILSLSVVNALALDAQTLPDVKDGVVSIQIKDPERRVGYNVGDVLTRHVTLSIKKPYKLIEESLPIVGYEKRYRGQPIGVDLSAITHSKKDDGDKVIHELTLSYQVFTNNVVAKPSALLAEYLRLINTETKGKEVVKYRIPSWEFSISPLSIFGQVKVEDDMSGFRGPLLLDNATEKKRLKILLTILVLSLLGLVYMLGKHAWLPRMGGPFSRSYREIRKLANNSQGIQQAVSSMHRALNMTAGNSLFSNNLEDFLAKKPAFKAVKSELIQFFDLSRQVFFEPNAQHQAGSDPIAWMAQLSRRCRDCERGLIPDNLNPERKA